jgi:hypothetical protein
MKPAYQGIKIILLIGFIGILTSFCASKNVLKINYQLPPESVTLKGAKVSLIFKDMRESHDILSRSARMALKDFSGNFALNVEQANKYEKLLGAFSLNSMLREIFKQRLKNAGIGVGGEDVLADPIFEVVLKQFKLDLVDHKWVVNMSYQVDVIKAQRVVAGETISGSAERMRVIGRKDAEMVIGELVTDVVNKLNLVELLQKSGV